MRKVRRLEELPLVTLCRNLMTYTSIRHLNLHNSRRHLFSSIHLKSSMPALSPPTALTITNPLVLYRSLVATKRIDPDPAQHRLALHLQKLYHRLKDYEPAVDYKHRLGRLSDVVAKSPSATNSQQDHGQAVEDAKHRGLFSSFWEQKEKAEALALIRRLTNHESAVQVQSPQGFCSTARWVPANLCSSIF